VETSGQDDKPAGNESGESGGGEEWGGTQPGGSQSADAGHAVPDDPPEDSMMDGGPGLPADDAGPVLSQAEDGGISAQEILPIENCFDPTLNDNLEGHLVTNGPAAEGGTLCNAEGALNLGDDQWAALAFSGNAGVALKQEEITSCLMIDLGRRCAVNEHIGIAMSHRLAGEVCGDTSQSDQCSVSQLCGDMPGAQVHLYAADSLEDIRFVVSAGSCGQSGSWLSSASPLTALSTTDDLEAVRYLLACRPAADCGAGAANIEIDALFLTHRL
jgi:hypothetical protein